jgi:hypothetical protein
LPIKTTITADANPEALKASIALLERYQAALAKLYGRDVLKAPHIASVSAASKDLAEFLQQHEAVAKSAAASGERFARTAQTVSKHFGGLAGNVEKSVANFTRFALTPLEAIVGEGALGGVALGAGLLTGGLALAVYGGYKGFQALARGAGDVTAQRRQALGLGVNYGALSSYELNFSRFGLGDQTLGNVATGIYDVTSPQFLPLLTSGAATGDTANSAVALIKSIPEMLRRDNVQDGNLGVYAHSHGWDQVLDFQSIIRLKNASPEEVQAQIRHYQADQQPLGISPDAQEKWSSFDTALDRAGRRIEAVLGDRLVPMAEPLTHLSESASHLIDALVNSGAVAKGLGIVETGLEGFGDALSSHNFHEDAKKFKAGIDALYPYLLLVGKALKFVGVASDVAKNGISGMHTGGPDAPPMTGTGNPSIRYYAGHGGDRPAASAVIDSATGKPVPRPTFKYSPITGAKLIDGEPDISYESTYSRKGEPLTDISGFIWHHTGSRGTPEDIVNVLNQRGLGVQYVMARDGTVYHTLPEGTRGAHIFPSEINNLSNANTEGMEVIALDDKDVTPQQIQSAREFAAAFSKTHPGVQYFGHGEVNPSHKQASEGLTIADAVRFGIEPTIITSTSSPVPLEKRTLMNFASGSVDADAVAAAPMTLPGAAPATPVGGKLGVDNNIGLRNPALRNRGRALHSLDPKPAAGGIDPHISAGHLTVYDYTGGATTVTMNNVHTAQ